MDEPFAVEKFERVLDGTAVVVVRLFSSYETGKVDNTEAEKLSEGFEDSGFYPVAAGLKCL